MSLSGIYLFLGLYACLEAVLMLLLKNMGSPGMLLGKTVATALSLFVFIRLKKLNLMETMNLPRYKSSFLLVFVVSIPVLVFTNALNSFVHKIFPPPAFWEEVRWERWKMISLPEGLSQWQWAWDIFSLVVVAGICEELIFRGVLLAHLAKLRGRWPGLLVVSSLFAIFHVDPWRTPDILIHGMYYGLIFFQFGSFWPAALAHGITNLWAVVQDHWEWEFLQYLFQDTALLPWIFTGCGILSVIGLRSIGEKSGGFAWAREFKWPGPWKRRILEASLVALSFLMLGGIWTYSRAARTIEGLSKLEGHISETERIFLEVVPREISQDVPEKDSLALSPLGDFLAYISHSSVILLNLKEGKKLTVFEKREMEPRPPIRWSPSGEKVAFGIFGKDPKIYNGLIYDLGSKKIETLKLFAPYAWLSDGKSLLGALGFGEGRWDVGVFSFRNGKPSLSSRYEWDQWPSGFPTHMFWGKKNILLIVYDGVRSMFYTLDPTRPWPLEKKEGLGNISWPEYSKGRMPARKSERPLYQVGGRIGSASLSPSLDKIAYNTIPGPRKQRAIVRHLTEKYTVCRLREASGVRWLNAGSLVMSSGDLPVAMRGRPRLKVFDLERLVEWQLWGTEGLSPGEFDCTPDGRRVVFVRDDGVYLADIPVGQMLRKGSP